MLLDRETRRWRAQVSEEYLEPIRAAGRNLRIKQVELREERERASGLTGLDYTQPFVMASSYGDAIPDSLARLAAMEEDYRRDLDALSERREEARAALAEMGGRSADLLRLRYVSALPWVTVANGMGLAEGTCRNMREEALSELYDHLPHHAKPPSSRAVPQIFRKS